MAKLGQIKSGTMRVGNTTASGYGIVYADEVIGHRRVNTYAELKTLPAWCLYNKAGGDSINTAIGQLWYVYNGDSSHVAGLYQLVGTDISSDASWKLFKNGADVSTHDTTYTFTNGSNGTFTVMPKGGSAQTVSIGKPSTAGIADSAKKADNATNATKAIQDKNGRDIVDTYLTKTSASDKYALKSDVSALSSALVYKGTIGTDGTITKLNVAAKVGDVYVAVAGAPTVNEVALEAGDMIIAKTEGDGINTQPTWTAIQTNINGAVTASGYLGSDMLVVGNGNQTIRAVGTSNNGFVKVANGGVIYDNNTYLTTTSASNTYAKKTDLSSYLTSVPTAKDNVVGGFKTGYTDATINSRNYGVKISPTTGQAYVSVPWTDSDTKYSLPVATKDVLGGIKIGFKQNDSEHNYPVVLSTANQAYVELPLATYNILNDTDQKDGLITGAERRAIHLLSLSGSSLANDGGLQLSLGGVIGDNNGTVVIPIATSDINDTSYGLMKGSDKKKLDGITSIPDSEIIKCFNL